MTQQSHYSAYTWENHNSKRHIFTAALFTIARTWTQGRCPSTDEWIKKLRGAVAQACPTLGNPMDCSLSGSSVHGIFQTRILKWVDISYRGDPSHPGIISASPALVGRPLLPLESHVFGFNNIQLSKQEQETTLYSCGFFFFFSQYSVRKTETSIKNISCMLKVQRERRAQQINLDVSILISSSQLAPVTLPVTPSGCWHPMTRCESFHRRRWHMASFGIKRVQLPFWWNKKS